MTNPTQADNLVRFWSKVDKSGECWIWTASKSASGYGSFGTVVAHSRRSHRAHRYIWEETNGPIPDGMFVCHKCDIRACVRIDHLFLGTPADNMTDMREKGRQLKGEKHHFAKLTSDDVYDIRSKLDAGASIDSVANEYSITRTNARLIQRRKTWAWLK